MLEDVTDELAHGLFTRGREFVEMAIHFPSKAVAFL